MERKEKCNEKAWKITAIIFIVLFVLATALITAIWTMGSESIKDEEKCAYEICEGYDAYDFDYMSDLCYCYKNNNRLPPVQVE